MIQMGVLYPVFHLVIIIICPVILGGGGHGKILQHMKMIYVIFHVILTYKQIIFFSYFLCEGISRWFLTELLTVHGQLDEPRIKTKVPKSRDYL